jgi:hypothetical protein
MTVLRQEYHDGVWREPAPLRSVARLDCYPWLVVGTVCIGAFMGQVDASIARLVLPEVGREFHASIGAAAGGPRCGPGLRTAGERRPGAGNGGKSPGAPVRHDLSERNATSQRGHLRNRTIA